MKFNVIFIFRDINIDLFFHDYKTLMINHIKNQISELYIKLSKLNYYI